MIWIVILWLIGGFLGVLWTNLRFIKILNEQFPTLPPESLRLDGWFITVIGSLLGPFMLPFGLWSNKYITGRMK